MNEQHVEVTRILLRNRIEMIAIWTASGNLEYYIRTELGVTMRITPQDAHTIAAMRVSDTVASWG